MRRTFTALTLALTSLMFAVLACTANDTLFIRLTETPIPTLTPTPLALDTKFKVGGTGVVVGVSDFASLVLPSLPGPFRPGITGGATCFPNSKVTVLDVSLNTADPSDKMIYYQIQGCSGIGWIPEYQLSRFARFDSAVVRTADGAGAPLFSSADASGAPSSEPCPEGTTVNVLSVTANAFAQTDQNVYIQVSCGTASGYVVEDNLAPVS